MDSRQVGARPRRGGPVAAVVAVAAAVLAMTAAPAISAETCPPGDLLQQEGVRATLAGVGAARVIGGPFLPEGSNPSGRALPLEAPLLFDLGGLRSLRAVMIQAGHDDVYVIEGSLDGATWSRLLVADAVEGPGLRSRALRLSRAASVRHLRVTATGGDGRFAVARIAAWCQVPDQPPAVASPPVRTGRRTIETVQGILALLGLALFATGMVLHRAGRAARWRHTRDGALAVLGLLAACAWWNFGGFHASGFVHTWEHVHYFLGAKYFDELGYTRLYACITVADAESGLHDRIASRRLRDMTTNRRVAAAAIASDPASCRRHFEDGRWDDFTRDVAWFRGKLHPAMWERVFLDHGYNAPPSWTLLGQSLTRRIPATDATVLALALLDPGLLALMWGAVIWAFGWRTCCVGLLWWGTNRMAYFAWTGGALLRQDWLLLTVLGICLVRRRHAVAGGFALGYATLLRVFPGLVVVALGLGVVARSLRARRVVLTRDQGRFAAGWLAALVLILPLSAAATGGFGSWGAFVDNTRANTRAAGANMVGLMKVLTYDHGARDATFAASPDPEADERRRESARARLQERRPLFWLLGAGFLILLARAVRDREDWAALALGIGLVPVGVFVASYYHAILLGYGLLWRRLGDAVGALLCLLSLATHVSARLWPDPVQMDTRFAWNSAATIMVVLALTWLAVGKRGEAAKPGRGQPEGVS